MDLTYQELLDFALLNATEFTLAWRGDSEFAESARDIDRKLAPFLIRKEKTSKWPGTELMSGTAIVKRYAVNQESLAILRTVDGIYAWRSPEFPEDLAFYSGERLLFVSIAHEEIAWFE